MRDAIELEWIPASDVSPWGALHDGVLVGVERHGDRARCVVEILYLFPEPGAQLTLELRGCATFEFTPYEGSPRAAPAEIEALELGILSARHVDGVVEVCCDAGILKAQYDALTLSLADGAPIALAALLERAERYWAWWARERPAP